MHWIKGSGLIASTSKYSRIKSLKPSCLIFLSFIPGKKISYQDETISKVDNLQYFLHITTKTKYYIKIVDK